MSGPIPEKCDENESCAQAPANPSRLSIRLPSLAEMAASVHRASADDSPAAEAERSSLDLSRFGLPKVTATEDAECTATHRSDSMFWKVLEATQPWRDIELSPRERYEKYQQVVFGKIGEFMAALRSGAVKSSTPQCRAMKPDFWLNELDLLSHETPAKFCWRIDGGPLRALLGKNFLGAEAWWGIGIDVGTAPPLPAALTETLLNSNCPFLPKYYKVKDTHFLTLVPKTVNGDEFNLLRLHELSQGMTESKKPYTISLDATVRDWKQEPLASAPVSESYWSLLPWLNLSNNFIKQNLYEQEQTREKLFPLYRSAGLLEALASRWLSSTFTSLDCDEIRSADLIQRPSTQRTAADEEVLTMKAYNTERYFHVCLRKPTNPDNYGLALARRFDI